MRILVLGGTGMLGHKLVQVLGEEHDVFMTIRSAYESVADYGIFDSDRTIPDFNAQKEVPIRRAIEFSEPNVVINAIGVVKQRPEVENVVETVTLNTVLPHMCAKLALEYGFRFINISTDCVFDGKRGNYSESDPPNAEDLYGQSKHWGEVSAQNCLTLRTSIIGRELGRSQGLIEWFLSNRGGSVRGYSNAIFSGFPTILFADIIKVLVSGYNDISGVYHVSSEPIDKYRLLCLANDSYGAKIKIEKSYELKIDRSLDSSKFRQITGFQPPSWPEMIEQMAADQTPYDKWKE